MVIIIIIFIVTIVILLLAVEFVPCKDEFQLTVMAVNSQINSNNRMFLGDKH